MPIKTVITKGKVPVKIYTDDIEREAYQQLLNIAQFPFVHSHIAAMPGVHYGKDATVGSVIPCKGAIIPAAVGVDIGCGMNALRLSIKADELPDNLRAVRSATEAAIPVGFDKHKTDKARASTVRGLSVGLDRLLYKHPKLLKMQTKPYLAYFKEGADHFDECVDGVHWAQDYAMENRREMMRLIVEALQKKLQKFAITKEAINCHHNYVSIEDHFGENVYITRKGAIRAGEGELGIIPGCPSR